MEEKPDTDPNFALSYFMFFSVVNKRKAELQKSTTYGLETTHSNLNSTV